MCGVLSRNVGPGFGLTAGRWVPVRVPVPRSGYPCRAATRLYPFVPGNLPAP